MVDAKTASSYCFAVKIGGAKKKVAKRRVRARKDSCSVIPLPLGESRERVLERRGSAWRVQK